MRRIRTNPATALHAPNASNQSRSFPGLGLQRDLDQLPDGFRAGRNARLPAAPMVDGKRFRLAEPDETAQL